MQIVPSPSSSSSFNDVQYNLSDRACSAVAMSRGKGKGELSPFWAAGETVCVGRGAT